MPYQTPQSYQPSEMEISQDMSATATATVAGTIGYPAAVHQPVPFQSQQIATIPNSRSASVTLLHNSVFGNGMDAQWQGNEPPGVDGFCMNPSTPTRGGYRNAGYRNSKSNRRASYSQGNGGAPQQKTNTSSSQFGPDGVKPTGWRRTDNDPQRHSSGTHQVGRHCPNSGPHHGLDYVPCDCYQCGERNRSVHVGVDGYSEAPSIDIQARLKFGLGDRFGKVEQVYPTYGRSFMVKYDEMALSLLQQS